jgi:hypothetical protein
VSGITASADGQREGEALLRPKRVSGLLSTCSLAGRTERVLPERLALPGLLPPREPLELRVLPVPLGPRRSEPLHSALPELPELPER